MTVRFFGKGGCSSSRPFHPHRRLPSWPLALHTMRRQLERQACCALAAAAAFFVGSFSLSAAC